MYVNRLGIGLGLYIIYILLFSSLFKPVFSYISTNANDIADLDEVRGLVILSGLDLKGWKEEKDPCGRVPCGVNVPPYDECNWEGIACLLQNNETRVVGIDIECDEENCLEGPLPHRLPENIETLSLQNNKLNGNLSNVLCDMVMCYDMWENNLHLKKIILSNNQISGELPTWANLIHLETIDLKGNCLNGNLPQSWSTKINLEHIDLSYNELSGQLPKSWGILLKLKFLLLNHNMLMHEIPNSWLEMSMLHLLDISENCGICGEVQDSAGIAIYADGTNINTPCSYCDGCNCSIGTWKLILTNILLSFCVLIAIICMCFISKYVKHHRTQNNTQPSQVSANTPLAAPTEKPTIVVMPDGYGVCMGVQVSQEPMTTTTTTTPTADAAATTNNSSSLRSESSIDFESTESSEDDDDEYSEGESDEESIDPKVLAFLYNSHPVMGTTGIFEDGRSPQQASDSNGVVKEPTRTAALRPEGYTSDKETQHESNLTRHRRAKSVIEGVSMRSLIAEKALQRRSQASNISHQTNNHNDITRISSLPTSSKTRVNSIMTPKQQQQISHSDNNNTSSMNSGPIVTPRDKYLNHSSINHGDGGNGIGHNNNNNNNTALRGILHDSLTMPASSSSRHQQHDRHKMLKKGAGVRRSRRRMKKTKKDGPAGDFMISEPQRSIRLPQDFDHAINHMNLIKEEDTQNMTDDAKS